MKSSFTFFFIVQKMNDYGAYTVIESFKTNSIFPEHILDLYCNRLLNASPFAKIMQNFVLMQSTLKIDWRGGL